MSVVLRKLNEAGVAAFGEYLSGLAAGAIHPAPTDLLSDSKFSSPHRSKVSLDEKRTFSDKMEFGRYLAATLDSELRESSADSDVGFWSWLALLYFDQLCPERKGLRKPGAMYRHILSADYNHRYRHLVRTPCMLYRLHGEHAYVVLGGSLDVHGEAAEQVLSRDKLFRNGPLFAVMDELFVVREARARTAAIKPGTKGKGGGSMRRLGKIVRQFDLTYDLQSMTPAAILDLLPGEFTRFKRKR